MAFVTAVLREGTQVNIQARTFSWRGDEPLAAGGTDSGEAGDVTQESHLPLAI